LNIGKRMLNIDLTSKIVVQYSSILEGFKLIN
jgi:hypothetical protein